MQRVPQNELQYLNSREILDLWLDKKQRREEEGVVKGGWDVVGAVEGGVVVGAVEGAVEGAVIGAVEGAVEFYNMKL